MSDAVKDWGLALLELTRGQTKAFGARLNEAERTAQGEAKHWSAKDEWAHVAFWLETFADNLDARLAGRTLKDIRDYRVLNASAWLERRAWTWDTADAALHNALTRLQGQIGGLSAAQLSDAAQFTLEPDRATPRPLIRTLLYEVVDHPTHHLVRLHAKTGRHDAVPALLHQTRGALKGRGMSAWTRPSLARLDKHAAWLEG